MQDPTPWIDLMEVFFMENCIGLFTKQNEKQRIGIYVWLVLFVALIFVHNPIDGYIFSYRVDYYSFNKYGSVFALNHRDADCFGWRQTLGSDASEKAKEVAYEQSKRAGCQDVRLLPFGEWSSISPFIPWFGSLIHLIYAVCLLCILLVGWLVTCRTELNHVEIKHDKN